jgi:hypothetical protein
MSEMGHKRPIGPRIADFRACPESGHPRRRREGPERARNRHCALFDKIDPYRRKPAFVQRSAINCGRELAVAWPTRRSDAGQTVRG